MTRILKAKIETLTYRAGNTMKASVLKEYPLRGFDINTAAASGIVTIDAKNSVAYSKWVTPKRTRSYPFARIYDTYSFGGKRITIIPVIKDEGLGASSNKSNNDRINFITLSWMNLTNVYVILAWYERAGKKSSSRITDQLFNAEYVRAKIKEISEYQLDAHHWNNQHFTHDFQTVYMRAVRAYQKLGKQLRVKMHTTAGHLTFLKKIVDEEDSSRIDLKKFAEETLSKSHRAAAREVNVIHKHEHLSSGGEKLVFEIRNNLGGRYALTADEICINEDTKELLIQEAKNSTADTLPKSADIKDGLFKILLFSQIQTITIDGVTYRHAVRLKLTGKLSKSLHLPTTKHAIDTFVHAEKLANPDAALLVMLNEEAVENGYTIEITRNGT